MVKNRSIRLVVFAGLILALAPFIASAQSSGYDHVRMPKGDVNGFWNSLSYADLSYAEQQVWAELGWFSWNWDGTTGVPDSEYTIWHDLNKRQRSAAATLGYSQKSWDEFVIRRPKGDVNLFWNGISYEDVTPAERKAWAALGWNAYNWDGTADIPASEYTIWHDLRPEQRDAALSLGYDQQSWDAFVIRRPRGDPDKFWSGFAYRDLTPAEQNAWAVLGWYVKNWEGKADAPASAYTYWSRLGQAQLEAATSLGYTQRSWDATVR